MIVRLLGAGLSSTASLSKGFEPPGTKSNIVKKMSSLREQRIKNGRQQRDTGETASLSEE
jgi:hypothetical protein